MALLQLHLQGPVAVEVLCFVCNDVNIEKPRIFFYFTWHVFIHRLCERWQIGQPAAPLHARLRQPVTSNFQKKEVRSRHWTGCLAQGRAPSRSKAPSASRFLSSGTSVLCFFVILSSRWLTDGGPSTEFGCLIRLVWGLPFSPRNAEGEIGKSWRDGWIQDFFLTIHTASAPITSGSHTDGGAVIR